jgi:hypothetical protein
MARRHCPARRERPAKRPRWRSTDAGQSRPSSTRGCSQAAARRVGATAGDDTIDGVHHPRDTLTAAIDGYGGDFVTQPRSQWDPARPRSGRSNSPQRVSNSPTLTLLGRLTMAPDAARLVLARRRALASDDHGTSQMVTGHSSVDIDPWSPSQCSALAHLAGPTPAKRLVSGAGLARERRQDQQLEETLETAR